MIKDIANLEYILKQLGIKSAAAKVSNLKKFLNKEYNIKIAVPLRDIEKYDIPYVGKNSVGPGTDPGIGWSLTDGEIETIKIDMKDTDNDLVFIIPSQTVSLDYILNSDEFKNWLELKAKEKGYNENYKFFIVGSSPLEEDYKDPKWIIHDLIGHTSFNIFNSNLRKDYESLDENIKNKLIKKDFNNAHNLWSELFLEIWDHLPEEFKLSKTDKSDRINDVYTAIALKKITKSEIDKIIEDNFNNNMHREFKEVVSIMFNAINSWMAKFKEGETFKIGNYKVKVIYPW